jgi:hypothetical protein
MNKAFKCHDYVLESTNSIFIYPPHFNLLKSSRGTTGGPPDMPPELQGIVPNDFLVG